MKRILKITAGLLVCAIVSWLAWQEIFRPSSSAAGQQAELVITSDELAADYSENEAQGNEKYLGKILQVSGEISQIEGGTPLTVVLNGTTMTQVRVELQQPPEKLPEPGEKIVVIGNCSGLLLDVVLNNGAIINP